MTTISPVASSRLELKIGCFFNVAWTAFSANGVRVRRAPRASKSAWYFLRSSINAVMSASSNCVTRGTAVQLSRIRWLITLRSGDSGFLEIAPHLEKSTASAAAPGAFAAAVAVFGRDSSVCSR